MCYDRISTAAYATHTYQVSRSQWVIHVLRSHLTRSLCYTHVSGIQSTMSDSCGTIASQPQPMLHTRIRYLHRSQSEIHVLRSHLTRSLCNNLKRLSLQIPSSCDAMLKNDSLYHVTKTRVDQAYKMSDTLKCFTEMLPYGEIPFFLLFFCVNKIIHLCVFMLTHFYFLWLIINSVHEYTCAMALRFVNSCLAFFSKIYQRLTIIIRYTYEMLSLDNETFAEQTKTHTIEKSLGSTEKFKLSWFKKKVTHIKNIKKCQLSSLFNMMETK